MSSYLEQIMKSANTMSDIRRKAASTENLKEEWMKSLEGMVTLLNARTERIALKGKSFQCEKPATEESVQEVEDDVRTLIHPEITKGKYTKSDLYKIDGYKDFMERHCIENQYTFQDPNQINISVQIGGQTFIVLSKVAEQIVTVPVRMNNNLFHIKVSLSTVSEGCKINVNGVELYIKCTDQDHGHQDDLHNVINYLQWYFVVLQFQDAIREGDLTRTNIILKTMIPFVYSHSALSKYFTECIDYILKTEIILPSDFALRVRAASFVNVHGGEGKNKAADMHKENEVKLLKDLIRGLGANKTENSIVVISKAAPVIQQIVQNYDNMLLIKKVNYKKRSSEEDIQAMIRVSKKNSLWVCEQRSLNSFKCFEKSPFSFDQSLFRVTVKNTVKRLLRGIPVPPEDDHDAEQENSDQSDAFSADEEDSDAVYIRKLREMVSSERIISN